MPGVKLGHCWPTEISSAWLGIIEFQVRTVQLKPRLKQTVVQASPSKGKQSNSPDSSENFGSGVRFRVGSRSVGASEVHLSA